LGGTLHCTSPPLSQVARSFCGVVIVLFWDCPDSSGAFRFRPHVNCPPLPLFCGVEASRTLPLDVSSLSSKFRNITLGGAGRAATSPSPSAASGDGTVARGSLTTFVAPAPTRALLVAARQVPPIRCSARQMARATHVLLGHKRGLNTRFEADSLGSQSSKPRESP
jgi:hypothetical protein